MKFSYLAFMAKRLKRSRKSRFCFGQPDEVVGAPKKVETLRNGAGTTPSRSLFSTRERHNNSTENSIADASAGRGVDPASSCSCFVVSIGVFLGLVFAAFAAEPAQLALELDAEGQREASAIEFRRLGLAEADSENAGNWFWLAAHEYALDKKQALSDRMLDRAEDETPFALAIPVSWLRAENAMQEKEWTAATFHFDSLQLKVEDAAMREFAARGSAAAHLREKEFTNALQALASAPGDLAAARKALEQYKGGRDKKPWVGGVLGMVPGLGYVYSGEYANGLRSLILNSLFIWGMVETGEDDEWGVFAVLTFVEFTWYSGSIYGGIDAAHRHNHR